MKLSVIGLGKLGACSAACFSYRGLETIGVDINKDFVDAINDGRAPVYEPRLQELIDASEGRLTATQDYKKALDDTDITFLIVPTPSRQDGHFSDRYLKDALTHLSEALKASKKDYHLFVITSTTSPGTTDKNLIPLIEEVSGRKLNEGFGVCYNPEFIALGSVITDFLNPDLLLIGESDKRAGDMLSSVYETVAENKPYYGRMSLVSAEVTKISINSYVTMKISFANTLANICEELPGSKIDDITGALGSDKRIAPYYLKGGLSFGGPCFPRDNRAFAAFAEDLGCKTPLAKATDKVNTYQIDHLAKRVLENIPKDSNKVISVLGLAYKPDTPVIEEAPGVRLIEELLRQRDVEIIAYDPLALDNARALFGDNILYASSVKDCLANSSVCIIATQDAEFKGIDSTLIVNDPTTIIDCWRILDEEGLGDKVDYIAIGRSKAASQSLDACLS